MLSNCCLELPEGRRASDMFAALIPSCSFKTETTLKGFIKNESLLGTVHYVFQQSIWKNVQIHQLQIWRQARDPAFTDTLRALITSERRQLRPVGKYGGEAGGYQLIFWARRVQEKRGICELEWSGGLAEKTGTELGVKVRLVYWAFHDRLFNILFIFQLQLTWNILGSCVQHSGETFI